MNKKSIKKSSALLLISIILLLSMIILNEKVYSAGGQVRSEGSRTEDTLYSGNYVRDNGEHRYVEPDKFNASGANYTVTTGGKSTTYRLFEKQEDVDRAIENGLCNPASSCRTGESMGFEGTRETWSEQLKNAGNGATKDGIKFDSSNPITVEYYREALKLRGIDTSTMSPDQIVAAATEIAYEEGGCASTNLQYATGVKDTETGQYFMCPGDSRCSDMELEGWCVTAITDMNLEFDSASTNDGGGMIELPPPPPSYTPIEPKKFEINSEDCELVIPEFDKISPKPIPSDSQTGGECGSTVVSKTYSTSKTACDLVVMLTTETTVAQLPSAPNIVYAGEGFNWRGIYSQTTSNTVEWDNSEFLNKQAEINAQIIGYTKVMNCTHSRLEKKEQECKGKKTVCENIKNTRATELYNCNKSCSEKCKDNYGSEKCSCDCSIAAKNYSDQAAECEKLTRQCDEIITNYENQYESYKNDLNLAINQRDELDSCEVTNIDSHSQTGTVTINNEKMELNTGYTQIIDTIRGVAKNSGMLLTAEEIENIDGETYLPVDTSFFIPYYVKNGTKGNLTGTVSGAISISNYTCPILVSNSYLCDDDCKDNTSNLNLIYRPISLTNPFPDASLASGYRKMGSNWTEGRVKLFITNNRGVSDYSIYNLKPIYTITLTPSIIKDIRRYNKKTSLNDFKMTCEEGYLCKSSFFWEEFDGIVDTQNSCASSEGWDSNCYDGGASE